MEIENQTFEDELINRVVSDKDMQDIRSFLECPPTQQHLEIAKDELHLHPIGNYIDRFESIDLKQKALIKAKNKLRGIVFEKGTAETKSHYEFVGRFFSRCLNVFKNSLNDIHITSIIEKNLCKILAFDIRKIETSYEDILKTLVSTEMHKKEKKILIIAFWDQFNKDSEFLENFQFKRTIIKIYDACLKKFQQQIEIEARINSKS